MTDNFIIDEYGCVHFDNANSALEYLDKFGYECPRFEDDDSLVYDGAKFSYDNMNYTTRGILFEDNGDCIRIYCGNFPNYYSEYKEYKRGERVKRPTLDVIDADGIHVNVGDTLWYVGDDNHDIGMPFEVMVRELRPDYYSNNGFEVVSTDGYMYKARVLSRVSKEVLYKAWNTRY